MSRTVATPWVKAAAATGVVCMALALAAPSVFADPPATPTVAFSDTFDGTTLDLTKWQYTLGTSYPGGPPQFGTWEIQENTDRPENVSVHDGSLYITPTKGADGKWKSARVESVSTEFKPAEGSTMTTEFRAALPDVTEANGSGYWPALWMNAATYRDDRMSWPMGGEFDIAESVSGGQWSNSVLHCGMHAPDSWGGPCGEPTGIAAGSVPLPGAWGSFNDYSFQWDRTKGAGFDQLRWYQNGVLTLTVDQADIPAEQWRTLSEHRGFHILMNVSIDGAYPDAKKLLSNANTEPGHAMRVDSVEVTYSAGGGTSAPTTPPTAPVTSSPATPPSSAPSSAPAATTAPPVTDGPTKLIAVGDSYPAGEGVGKDDAYPALVGAALDYTVENNAVSGSKSTVLVDQLAGTGDAGVVLVQSGGNDVHALNQVDDVLAGGSEEFIARMPALQTQLTEAYAGVVGAKPGADVVVLTYPDFIEACLPGDVAGAHQAVAALNGAVANAAEAAGATVVESDFTGHGACSSTPWVDATGHPNAAGHAALADQVLAALEDGAAPAPSSAPAPTSAPEPTTAPAPAPAPVLPGPAPIDTPQDLPPAGSFDEDEAAWWAFLSAHEAEIRSLVEQFRR